MTKTLAILALIVVVGCNEPTSTPKLGVGDLAISNAETTPVVSRVGPAGESNTIGIVIAVYPYASRWGTWQYVVAFPGTTQKFLEDQLYKVGHINWSDLNKFRDDAKPELKIGTQGTSK